MSERGESPGALRISSSASDLDGVRLALAGELDLAGAPQLERSLQELERQRPRRVVIDLAGLSFIDSTGLRVLLQAQARLGEQGSELLLRPGEPAVQRVFDVTGAIRVLRFEAVGSDGSERPSGELR